MDDKLKVVAWMTTGTPKQPNKISPEVCTNSAYKDVHKEWVWQPLVLESEAQAAIGAALERVKVLEAMYEARELEAHQLSEKIIVLRREKEVLEAERDEANETLARIGDFAHDKSTGPAVPDALWEVRSMAYDAVRFYDLDAAMEVKHG